MTHLLRFGDHILGALHSVVNRPESEADGGIAPGRVPGFSLALPIACASDQCSVAAAGNVPVCTASAITARSSSGRESTLAAIHST